MLYLRATFFRARLVPLSHTQPCFLVLNSYLSLFLPLRETKYCCCGNGSQRGDGQLMRLPVWRQKAYIWSFPACAPGGGFNLVWTLCLSFQCERQMEWQTEWETEEQRKGHEEKERHMGSGWYWSLDLLGTVLLLLGHPAFVAQYNLGYSELYISALLLWLWLTALKNTLKNLLHHGCRQCSSNPQGQHSAAEYWSAHKCELNRMAMIDLKCGASSLKQICGRDRKSVV